MATNDCISKDYAQKKKTKIKLLKCLKTVYFLRVDFISCLLLKWIKSEFLTFYVLLNMCYLKWGKNKKMEWFVQSKGTKSKNSIKLRKALLIWN